MDLLYKLARPFFFCLSGETAHQLTLLAMKMGTAPCPKPIHHKALQVTLWDRKFPNPIGLAAGFDKNAEVIDACLKLGFGHTEIGTVTPRPQAGNPKPRIFRDTPNNAVINRMGFPNAGVQTFKDNLTAFLSKKNRPQGVIGINIGMNKTQKEPEKDYTMLVRLLAPMADYLTINISSPNTPRLRNLQEPESFKALIATVREELTKSCGDHVPPLLVKLAPDLSEDEQKALAVAALECKIDGLILTNTTLDRPDTLTPKISKETGGLSGAPLKDKSTQIIRNFYKYTEGKLPIIGVGGVASAQDAYEKIKAGASLVQLYTGMIYEGPNLIAKINTELLDLLDQDGYNHISDAVGQGI